MAEDVTEPYRPYSSHPERGDGQIGPSPSSPSELCLGAEGTVTIHPADVLGSGSGLGGPRPSAGGNPQPSHQGRIHGLSRPPGPLPRGGREQLRRHVARPIGFAIAAHPRLFRLRSGRQKELGGGPDRRSKQLPTESRSVPQLLAASRYASPAERPGPADSGPLRPLRVPPVRWCAPHDGESRSKR